MGGTSNASTLRRGEDIEKCENSGPARTSASMFGETESYNRTGSSLRANFFVR